MLRDAEYRLLVDQSPMIIWRAGTDAKCDYFNARWLAFTGRTLQQELGDGWTEGVHPEDLQRCVGIWLDAFARRVPFEMEYRLRRHDGAWRWILDCGAPTLATDGAFLGYIGNCVDVTERVEADAALARAHRQEVERLHELLPICACCKSIRNDAGYWQRVETYLHQQAGLTFTHTYCPSCVERLYPEPAAVRAAPGADRRG
jgi:PAS domain S-box-containing protein